MKATSYDEEVEKRLKQIESIVTLAEEWSERQLMEQSLITMSALKDIRRIVRKPLY